MSYIPLDIHKMSFYPHPTYTDLVNSLDKIIKAEISEAERLLQERQSATCFSCGSALEMTTRGRSRYCARCGCYLPSIIYDIPHSFTDSVKPTKTVNAPYMPTKYSH